MAEWVAVARAETLEPARRALVRFDGHEVAIFRVDGTLHALEDSCPHGGASLCTGRLEGGHVQCLAHGLRFRLGDGALAGTPAGARPALGARVFPIREQDGWLQLQRGAGAASPGAALSPPTHHAPGCASASATCRTGR